MLNRLFATSLFVAINLLYFGQSLHWSNAEMLNQLEVSDIYSTSDSTIYVVKQSEDHPHEISFEVFDYDLAKISSGKTSFEVDEINHIDLFNDALHIFGVKHHGKEDELIAFEVDQEGKIVKNKSLLKCKAYGGYYAYFDVRISPEQNFCAIIGSDGYDPDQKEIIHSILYDKNWEEHHHKEIMTSILSQKKSYNAITVNDKGVTYIMKRERKKGADKYYVFCISESGAENHHELHLKSRNIMDMRFDLDTLGDLYLAGFYAAPYKTMFEGIYIKKLNPEGTELFSKEYMFNENIIDAFNSKKDIKEFGYGLRKFHTHHFGFVDEKNLILETEHSTRIKGKNDEFEYIQNGFVAINLSNKGGFQYAVPVMTEQTDEEHGGYWNSHCHVNYNGEHLIFANILGDGAKGVKEDLPANAKFHPFQIKLTANGTEKRELQSFDVNLENYAIYPSFKNHSELPILILKSINKDQYAIGLLKPSHE